MLIMVCIATIMACSKPAYLKVDLQAEEAGFSRKTVQGEGFRHVIYASINATGNDTVHIYVDGDGVNWQWNRLVKADPTPERSIMLDLMKIDRNDALYVGRPCYLGLELDDSCNADHWTYERFSQDIVDSMASVIRAEASRYAQVVLIGHSGGGALALLLAEKIPTVTKVVTIAGIIDTDAWTTHHGYTRLVGSLNPATQPPLPERVKQLHLVGGLDNNIPASLVKPWVANQPGARLWELPGNSHVCCWNNNWPQVLRWIASGSDLPFKKTQQVTLRPNENRRVNEDR